MGLFNFFKKKESAESKPTPKLKITCSVVGPQGEAEVVPIERRISNIRPTCDSLYPHEVLVLSYADKFNASKNEFQRFWWYKYGIKDVQAILRKLESKNLIQIGNVEDALKNQKLEQLKQVLKNNGLKVSGKKNDIIQRILDNVSQEKLNVLFPIKPYKRTQNGEILLKKYEWIPYIHKHSIDDLDIWNLTEMMQTPPYRNYRDEIWGYLNKTGMKYLKKGQFGLYRNTRLIMSEFLMEEHKEDRAFKFLCEVVTYDLSGLFNGFDLKDVVQYYKSFYPYKDSLVKMAPGITGRISDMSRNFGWNEKELSQRLLQEISNIQLPFTIFTPEEKVEIVIAEMNEDKQKLECIYIFSANRFKKKYKIN